MVRGFSDVNSFKLFLYVSTYFCLPIGGGTQSHQDIGGLQHMGNISRKWEDLKSRGHHALEFIRNTTLFIFIKLYLNEIMCHSTHSLKMWIK